MSLRTGIIPSEMKIARVTPIYKKDDVHNLNNLNGKLESTYLTINKSTFGVSGEIQPKNNRYYFNVNSRKTTINTILSLLPNSISSTFSKLILFNLLTTLGVA